MQSRKGKYSSPQKGDRFISNRSNLNLEASRFYLRKENDNPYSDDMSSTRVYSGMLKDHILDDASPKKRIMALTMPISPTSISSSNSPRILREWKDHGGLSPLTNKTLRHIPQVPEKVLDAPGLLDDYYLNLLSWGVHNTLAVALGSAVYLWNATSGDTVHLMSLSEDDIVSSVSWSPDGQFLAVGTAAAAEVQLWDATEMRKCRTFFGHSDRVSATAWGGPGACPLLSAAGRDPVIINHDLRAPRSKVSSLVGHEQEVCGLRWSPSGMHLASGGNDNMLTVWDSSQWSSRFSSRDHNAAVKALAWCPWESNVLVSGGGTADKTLKFWDTSVGKCMQSVNTKSQVCAVVWSKNEKELVTSHGYSQNSLLVWKYPSMVRLAELSGHGQRVLQLEGSPDGSTVVSGAADETLRFWRIFPEQPRSPSAKRSPGSSPMSNARVVGAQRRMRTSPYKHSCLSPNPVHSACSYISAVAEGAGISIQDTIYTTHNSVSTPCITSSPQPKTPGRSIRPTVAGGESPISHERNPFHFLR
eukprot:Rmarinus@m.8558